ncbi:MAG: DEAD/DEAH box helicase [Candidatus Acididesulfobacter guangdongensis]|uniref:DEAD/DEAH box helicase n=1 Tax=Acididesulfobacter guangdongensis TaxID=2597225 RepID=A0A519BIQ7_ACIG2|nr:MAG: DEAD/DEAH box helicase [Candidatus Acididesulfobacter guangdongensis]
MSNPHHEIHLESDICEHLAANGWLYSPNDDGYNRELALYPEDVFSWVSQTQPELWDKLRQTHNGDTNNTFRKRLAQVLDNEGSLAVLRGGFKNVSSGRIQMCQFRPAQTMNPETTFKYEQVRCRVMRQVHYSTSNENSIDLVFFVNGIPVATAELKTDFTQSVHEAIHQYKYDRMPKDPNTKREEPLLAFKRRTLVHFAASSDEVYMTTMLNGKDTKFLPFNLGDNGGAGNPANPNGYRTSYLWERIWQKDAWLDILGRFVHLGREDKKDASGKKSSLEKLIFPRFHQWDVVTRLIAAAREEKAGAKYLVQHSAGSGKTNSISWLSHQLSSLHSLADGKDERVFHSVIVITDRNILDSQLQDAIYQFEHKEGVVCRIKEGVKSAQLAKALKDGIPIIVVTIQTFHFVLEAIRKETSLKGRKFAVIADEAHSSQAGSMAKALKQVLTAEQIEEGEEISADDLLAAEMAARPQSSNVSYFAFTATPKHKTMELFGRRPDPNLPSSETNKPDAFHIYSMRQAIEEGFILDVLKNYTAYKLAFKLAHNGQDYDEETLDESKAMKSLMRWVRLHPYNISQKVQIIVEHFRANVEWRLNGEAKAMVVTSSRKEAVRYKLAIDKYIRDKGYEIGTLVAFSGEVADQGISPDSFSEFNMNPGLRERDLRDAFDTDEFSILLVANKYQTGFDQPKLTAMYVDKKLAGINAVQTLSRLDRTFPGKDQTFILDFVNDPEEIRISFLPYYDKAELAGVSDPNIIHDMQAKLDSHRIYTQSEIDGFVAAYYKESQKDMQARIAPAVDRFRNIWKAALESKDKKGLDALEIFRKDLRAFISAYDFLSQIIDYRDTDLEKRSIFYKHLLPLIKEENLNEPIDLSSVKLTHYNLIDKGKRDIKLDGTNDDGKLKPLTGIGTAKPHDPEQAFLSEIIVRINDLFEGDLSDADKLSYAQHIRGKMMENEILSLQAEANTKEQFASSPDFKDAMNSAVTDGLENYNEMAKQILNNEYKREELANILLDMVYMGFAEKRMKINERRDECKLEKSIMQTSNGHSLKIVSDIDISESEKFVSFLPIYSLEAAATAFGREEYVENSGWMIATVAGRKLNKDMFIAKVVGKSMEPTIPDGSYCIFRLDKGGSRNETVVLVESKQVADRDTNQKFTVKRYHSEKEYFEDGTWRHKRITLSPDNKEFEPIILENMQETDFRVVAEFIGVI